MRCVKANVPYQIARGAEFYNRKEIKDVLAYLRVIANPADEVSLDAHRQRPHARHRRHEREADAGLRDRQRHDAVGGDGAGGQRRRAVHAGGQFASRSFVELVEPVAKARRRIAPRAAISSASRRAVVQTIMEDVVRNSGIEALLRKEDKAAETGDSALANVNELITAAAEYDARQPRRLARRLPRRSSASSATPTT